MVSPLLSSCWRNWVLCFSNESICKWWIYSAFWRWPRSPRVLKCVMQRWSHTLKKTECTSQIIWNSHLFLLSVYPTLWSEQQTLAPMHAVCLALIAALLTDYLPFVMQVRYKEDYEKNKGRAYTSVTDDPEMIRVKKTQQQVSGVSVCSFVTTFSSSSSCPQKSQPQWQTIFSSCQLVMLSHVGNLSFPFNKAKYLALCSFSHPFVQSIVFFHFSVNVRKCRT